MDRPSLRPVPPLVEPRIVLPVDIDEDPADESIYGMGYRARVGVVVSERPAAQPAAENDGVTVAGTVAAR